MSDPNQPADPAAVVAAEAAKVDFSRDMSYGDYLHLDEILARSSRARPRTTRCSSSSSTR